MCKHVGGIVIMLQKARKHQDRAEQKRQVDSERSPWSAEELKAANALLNEAQPVSKMSPKLAVMNEKPSALE